MEKPKKQQYVFWEEQVRKKPFFKRKGFKRVVRIIGSGILFGAVAGVVFSITNPLAREEIAALAVLMRNRTDEGAAETPETAERTETRSIGTEDSIPGLWAMDVYRTGYRGVVAMAAEAEKAIAYVDAKEEELINKFDDSRMQTAGLVLGNDDEHLYVLASLNEEDAGKTLIVTLADGVPREGKLFRRDEFSSLSVIRLPIEELGDQALAQISPADFYVGDRIEKGEPVIALGSPQSYSEAMGSRMITSVLKNTIMDGEYSVFATSIPGSTDGTGVLLNLTGQIIGLIVPGFGPQQTQISVTALDVQDLWYLLESLCEDKERPYMGIQGTAISAVMAEETDIPRGIYIKGVEAGSPALLAGIRAGDILTYMDGEAVYTMDEYENQLNGQEPGAALDVTLVRQTADGYAEKKIRVQLEGKLGQGQRKRS